MADINFSRAARFRAGGGAPISIVARKGRGGAPRTFEYAAASRVGVTLDIFKVSPGMRASLISEAEKIEGITSLNPAMLAAAQYFFHLTRGTYTDALLRSRGPELLRVLEQEGAVGTRSDIPAQEVNLLNLVRYICIIGNTRGVQGLPNFI